MHDSIFDPLFSRHEKLFDGFAKSMSTGNLESVNLFVRYFERSCRLSYSKTWLQKGGVGDNKTKEGEEMR